ncbi:MAG: hypothetical protein KIT33_14690 [Candidatus Kapabacteria bacterium]|nr:hypothetical protein [Ignavibacteriota bacterium]MCW5886215.1 hypothetical protein [Candidatus Kapabacteria bacterium]
MIKEKKDKANEVISSVEDYLIGEFGNFYEQMGGKNLYGRIFGLLLSKTQPVSLKDISARLQVSKPAVSTTAQTGAYMEVFKKVYMSDFPREDFYTVSIDFLQTLIKPGVIKISMLSEKFSKACLMISENYPDYDSNPELKDLYNRVCYIKQALLIFIEEYDKFGEKVKERISKELRIHNIN